MLDDVVVARELTRTFGSRTAVRDLSFTVRAGEIVALLGPNGAGKTTTLRMLAGLIAPSKGAVSVDGSVGLLTESPGLWDTLSVQLNLLTYARLHGLVRPEARVSEALASMDLSDRAGDTAGTLSSGLRQRVAIARALLHNPTLVLLDEPTSRLDPANARRIRDVIADLRREGRAVLLSTHNLVEAETLADRIGILNVSLLALDSPARLRQRTAHVNVAVDVEGPASAWTTTLERLNVAVTPAGSRLTIALDRAERIPDLVAALVSAGARVVRVASESRTLEDVYLEMVGS